MVASQVPAPPPGPPGVVVTSTVGEVLRVRFAGEVDLWLRAALEAALGEVRRHDGPVELDLREVTFFGAEGAGALLSMLDAHPWGRVSVVGASPAVRRTLGLCGVTPDMLPGSGGSGGSSGQAGPSGSS